MSSVLDIHLNTKFCKTVFFDTGSGEGLQGVST